MRFGFGAGVDRSYHAAFEERFGFPLLEAWAMTETGVGRLRHGAPRAAPRRHELLRPRRRRDVEARIVDDDGRRRRPPAMPGELLVRAAGADPRRGFFSATSRTRRRPRRRGPAAGSTPATSCARDADGDLHFVDRKKNVIRRSGENISAVEVESVLNQHPAVQACGGRRRRPTRCAATRCWPASSCASRSTPPAREALAREHRRATRSAQLAYFKAPGYVAFVDALPLTPSQKIQRGELQGHGARSCPASAHCIDTRALKKRRTAVT